MVLKILVPIQSYPILSVFFKQVHQKIQGFENKNWILIKFDENIVFIRFHQISSEESRFWKKPELWWNLMKFGENMVFHQISSTFIKKIKILKKKMNFDEIWWKHGFSSNFIKFHQSSSKKSRFWKKKWTLMKFDENQVFIKFHQISSKFTKIHQN